MAGFTCMYGCPNKASAGATIVKKELYIMAPNGNLLYMRTARIVMIGQQPVVVLVQGGLGNGAPMLDTSYASQLINAGYVVVSFNPEGRGSGSAGDMQSQGAENYNGYIHQDDLYAVISYMQTLPFVARNRVGIVSFSYGIAMAAGCLGRYPALSVNFLLDIEGPSDSYGIMGDGWSLDTDTTNDMSDILFGVFGHYSTAMDNSEMNIAWWSEREAARFIGNTNAAYMRLQAQYDHMQPPNQLFPTGFDFPPVWYQNKHAVDMVNAAVNGSSRWVRMNDAAIWNAPNSLYSYGYQPIYYSGQFDPTSASFAVLLSGAVGELLSH